VLSKETEGGQTGSDDYAKGIYIIVKSSKKWEGISKNQEMGSGLPNNMSSEGRGMHEAATSMRCK
jgi:hypothetical protein